jgi:multidrug efflux pump subunit AcrB
MLGCFIFWGLRKPPLVVFVAACLLILTAANLRNKPQEARAAFWPWSLTVKTELVGLSSAGVEQLVTVPLEVGLLNGLPRLQIIHPKSVASRSTINKAFAPGTASEHGSHDARLGTHRAERFQPRGLASTAQQGPTGTKARVNGLLGERITSAKRLWRLASS